MIYPIKDYQKKYHPTKSLRTVQRMAASELMPSNHTFVKAHDWFVEVDEYLPACVEFHAKKTTEIDSRILATVISVKYKIDKNKLFKMVGL